MDCKNCDKKMTTFTLDGIKYNCCKRCDVWYREDLGEWWYRTEGIKVHD